MKTITSAIAAGLLLAVLAGCAGTKPKPGFVIEKDVSRVIKLKDGTTCVEPARLAQTRETPVAVKLKEVFDSEEPAAEALTKAKALNPTREETEAVYFDACRAYANGDIPEWAFDRDRIIYAGLDEQLFAQGVKRWMDKKDGIADAGKLCLVRLPDTDPDHRSFTRVVPEDSTVDDCARLARSNGSSEILLGCTEGHWQDRWAKKPIGIGSAGSKSKVLTAKGTTRAPDPDCGWN
jgi:hypothetical protein